MRVFLRLILSLHASTHACMCPHRRASQSPEQQQLVTANLANRNTESEELLRYMQLSLSLCV